MECTQCSLHGPVALTGSQERGHWSAGPGCREGCRQEWAFLGCQTFVGDKQQVELTAETETLGGAG